MKRIGILFLICSILFFSCSTNKFFVPGEKQAKIKNIYAEYYNLAEEYVLQGKYDKAIECYKNAMNENSLHNVSYYKLGRCYALNKQYDKAEEIFKNILENDNDNVSVKSSLAYLAAMNGNLSESLSLYKNLIQENPENPELLVNYISVLISAKDFNSAKINLEFLETKFPNTEQIKALKENLESSIENNETK